MNEFENGAAQNETEIPVQTETETAEEKCEVSDTAAEVVSEPTQAEAESSSEAAPEPQAVEQSAPQPVIPEKVEYSPIEKKEKEKASKGLKVFCVCIAAIIVLTGCCTVGYLFGRKSIYPSPEKHSAIELASRPKDQDAMTPAQVYEKLNNSVLGIIAYNEQGDSAEGTCVVYSKDGYLVTNDHIFKEVSAAKCRIFFPDGTDCPATFVASDLISDLAVVKIDKTDLQVAEFCNSDEVFSGEQVVAIGRTVDAIKESSITSGIVSLTKRRVKGSSSYSSSFIQTDAAINPGSSGGALCNLYGQVMGITSSKLAGTVYDAVGFAIPSKTVKRIAEELIKNGKVTNRAKLGITYSMVNTVSAEVMGISAPGIQVVEISTESPLFEKVNQNDVITHINGLAITDDAVVLDIIENSQPGDTVKLTVLSDGESKEIEIALIQNEPQSSYNPILIPKENQQDEQTAPSEAQPGNDQDNNSSGGGTFNFPFGN